MSEKKDSAAAVLTGSTGNTAIDLTPRTAWITFAGAVATIVCIAIDADAALTGAIVTASTTGAQLAAVGFDTVVRPRL